MQAGCCSSVEVPGRNSANLSPNGSKGQKALVAFPVNDGTASRCHVLVTLEHVTDDPSKRTDNSTAADRKRWCRKRAAQRVRKGRAARDSKCR